MSRETITQHEGSKYLKRIYSPVKDAADAAPAILVDVYAVLEAFEVTCPAIAHCIKKLLMPGQRGKGGVMADLKGAMAALNRAIELEELRQAPKALKVPPPADPQHIAEKLGLLTPEMLQETIKKLREETKEAQRAAASSKPTSIVRADRGDMAHPQHVAEKLGLLTPERLAETIDKLQKRMGVSPVSTPEDSAVKALEASLGKNASALSEPEPEPEPETEEALRSKTDAPKEAVPLDTFLGDFASALLGPAQETEETPAEDYRNKVSWRDVPAKATYLRAGHCYIKGSDNALPHRTQDVFVTDEVMAEINTQRTTDTAATEKGTEA